MDLLKEMQGLVEYFKELEEEYKKQMENTKNNEMRYLYQGEYITIRYARQKLDMRLRPYRNNYED